MRRDRGLATLLALLSVGGCGASPLLDVSANDVGAVLQPLSQSNIADARADFRRMFCAVNTDHGAQLPDYRDCEEALHRLADEPVEQGGPAPTLQFRNRLHTVVIPGIFGECLIDQISPFSYAIEHVNQYPGIYVEVLRAIRGRASSEHNSAIINQYLQDLDLDEDTKLVIVAFSKGTTDSLSFLGNQAWTDSAAKVDALVSIAGVVNGTPIADDTNALLKFIAEVFPYGECPTQDASGIDDLTRENQFLRLSTLELPDHVQYFSLPAYASRADTSRLMHDSFDRLSLVDPRNDGQVIYFDSIIPRARLLGFANGDHWAVALPFARHREDLRFINRIIANGADRNDYPREVLLESILRYVDTVL